MSKMNVRNEKYLEARYSRQQMRDTIAGSNAIKRKGELYLPMPSSWADVPPAPGASKTANDYNAPFLHPNPAYQAYLQRARFPDITANGLRGMMGVASKVPPEIDLPSSIAYLETEVNSSGLSIAEFYDFILGEMLTVGNVNIVVDYDTDLNRFYLTTYTAESTIDWNYDQIKGSVDIHDISFIESVEEDGSETILKYEFDEDLKVVVQLYSDGDPIGPPREISHFGRRYEKIPVFPAGTIENIPDPQPIPLLGISDIALEIYQENADLRQAHFLTCNPTLFIFGAKESERPTTVGSQVIVMLQNPQGRAEYPATDTSALNHIKEYIHERYQEAASYGANILISGAKESGEALSVRQASRGANLVKCAKQAGAAIENALNFIAEISGLNPDSVVFKPSTEFAEMVLNSQDINSLVLGWLQGAWDRETVLDNMRAAGYISHSKTNSDVINNIENSPPSIEE